MNKFECTYELCGFEFETMWSVLAEALRCPECQGEVRSCKESTK